MVSGYTFSTSFNEVESYVSIAVMGQYGTMTITMQRGKGPQMLMKEVSKEDFGGSVKSLGHLGAPQRYLRGIQRVLGGA